MFLPLALALTQVGDPDVPVIGTLAGTTVGQTTIEQFERKHGKGFVLTGGHSGGAREWFDAAHDLDIWADGFNYDPKGEEVIDTVMVEWGRTSSPSKKVPRIHLKDSEMGMLTLVRRGMTYAQVQSAIGTTQTLDEVTMLGLVTYPAKLVNKDDDRYQTWTATFDFDSKGLTGISVMAE